jgi:hypothetical protein
MLEENSACECINDQIFPFCVEATVQEIEYFHSIWQSMLLGNSYCLSKSNNGYGILHARKPRLSFNQSQLCRREKHLQGDQRVIENVSRIHNDSLSGLAGHQRPDWGGTAGERSSQGSNCDTISQLHLFIGFACVSCDSSNPELSQIDIRTVACSHMHLLSSQLRSWPRIIAFMFWPHDCTIFRNSASLNRLFDDCIGQAIRSKIMR